MTMHDGLDLSRFKKISSDGKSSTLKHTKGHEIKIAHNSLGDKMREHIKGMPIYAAEGADIKGDDEDKEKPLGDVAPPEPVVSEAPPVMPEAPAPVAPPPMSQGAPPMMSGQPPVQEQIRLGISPEEKMQEHVNFATDMANGQIHPKTYHELFAEKSTLGKIGTLFGLMISGMGSGLTHQPNALLEMMNKELERDFEKQKVNKEGARNFLSTHSQSALQESQTLAQKIHAASENVDLAHKAGAAQQYLQSVGAPGSGNFLIDMMHKANAAWAPYEAQAKMAQVIPQYLSDKSPNNPKAQAVIRDVITPAVNKKVGDLMQQGHNAAKAASDSAVKKEQSLKSGMNESAVQNPVNEKALFTAIQRGQNTPQGYGYQRGAINPADVPKIQEEKAQMQALRKGYSEYVDSFKNIAGMNKAGEAPGISGAITAASGIAGGLLGALGSVGIGGPAGAAAGSGAGHVIGEVTQSAFERERDTQVQALQDKLVRQLNISGDRASALARSILPAWNDNDKSRDAAFKKGTALFKDSENPATLKTYADSIPGLMSEFPSAEWRTVKPVERSDAKESPKKRK